MRTRVTIGALLFLLFAAMFLGWFASEAPTDVRVVEGPPAAPLPTRGPAPSIRRPTLPVPSDEPEDASLNRKLLNEAAMGVLGLDAMTATCELCKEHGLREVCDRCPPGEGPWALVRFDQVDVDGRPLDDMEQGFVYSSCVQPRMSDRVVAPEGPCTFTLFTYGPGGHRQTGESVTMELVGGEEYSVVLGQLPQPDGWVPVTLAATSDGSHLRVLEGTTELPEGMWLLTVDGVEVRPDTLYEAQRLLTADIGETIPVRYLDPETNTEHETTVSTERRP